MSVCISDPPYIFAASEWVREAIAPSEDILETTTDAELEQLAVDWLQQAEEEGVIIQGDLLPGLHEIRDRVRARQNKS